MLAKQSAACMQLMSISGVGLHEAAKGNVQVVTVNIETLDTFRAVEHASSSLTVTLTNDQY